MERLALNRDLRGICGAGKHVRPVFLPQRRDALRGILNRFLYMTAHFRDCERKSVLLTSRHVFDSAVGQLLWPLTIGGEVVIPRKAGHLDLLHMVELIQRQQVTMTDFVPSIFNTQSKLLPKARRLWRDFH